MQQLVHVASMSHVLLALSEQLDMFHSQMLRLESVPFLPAQLITILQVCFFSRIPSRIALEATM